MTLVVFAALVGAGLLVGFVSGLIGIGGGVLIVPLLYFYYGHPSWSGSTVAPGLEAAVAHATSLFVIMPTGLLGATEYHRSRLVEWKAALPVAAVSIPAAVLGSQIAVLLPPEALKAGFGLLLVVAGADVVRERSASGAERPLRMTAWRVGLTGTAVGLFSALLGVGGGIIAIPMLLYVIGLDLRRVAATSLAIVALTASAGAVAYGLSGLGSDGTPDGSIGYVHVVGAIPIIVGALLAVRWGALANQRLHVRALRWLFGALFAGLGLRLLVLNLF